MQMRVTTCTKFSHSRAVIDACDEVFTNMSSEIVRIDSNTTRLPSRAIVQLAVEVIVGFIAGKSSPSIKPVIVPLASGMVDSGVGMYSGARITVEGVPEVAL